MKAADQRALSVGWHTRNLHYVRHLKPLTEYLKPPRSARDGAMSVLAMFRRWAKRTKEADDGVR